MRRAILAAALSAAILVAPGGAQPDQQTTLIVFASTRSAVLIPFETRSVDPRSGRSSRVGIIPTAIRVPVVWSPDGSAIAYAGPLGDLYVVRPGGRASRIARRLGETNDRPAWSPSGRLIAYFGRDRGRLSVYVVRSRGGGLRRVARRIADAPDLKPGDGLAWSPDSGRIAIVASRGGKYRLVVADLRTGRQRRLPTGRGRPRDPAWSPNGRTIAFQAQVPGERANVRTIDVETDRVRRVHSPGGSPLWSPDGRRLAVDEKHRLLLITGAGTRLLAAHGALSSPPAWSPDSERLVFQGRNDFVVADVGSRRVRRLTRETRVFEPWTAPAWSARGRVVYIGRRRDPRDLDLDVVAADGTGVRSLTTNDVSDQQPAWSPDGRLVAFDSPGGLRVIGSDGSGERTVAIGFSNPSWSPDGTMLAAERGGDIWVVGVDGSGARALTSGPDEDTQPDWSPDGSEIAFARRAQIHAISMASGEVRVVTRIRTTVEACAGGRAARNPAWAHDGARVAFEVLTTCSTRGSNEIYIASADGSGERQVTHLTQTHSDGPTSPSWSPDGAEIVFQLHYEDSRPEYEDRRRIAAVRAAGGGFRFITPPLYDAFMPDTRPSP